MISGLDLLEGLRAVGLRWSAEVSRPQGFIGFYDWEDLTSTQTLSVRPARNKSFLPSRSVSVGPFSREPHQSRHTAASQGKGLMEELIKNQQILTNPRPYA